MIYRRFAFLCAAGALLSASHTFAAPIIDGSLDAAYGAAKATVAFDPTVPDSNFQAPTAGSNTTAYSIYLLDTGGMYYGFLKSATVTNLPFANLYFDLDPQNGNGSDFGIEITNSRAFIPAAGAPPFAAVPGLTFAVSADGTGIEFAFSNTAFETALAGLSYASGQQFATDGSDVVLRLSQSFGFSVQGGDTFGDARLGEVTLDDATAAAVPEPESLALLGLGVGALAIARRRKAR
jgi:hypothetical protein